MTQSDIAEKLRPISCYLLDMDGTFYLGDRLIEGSLDFLRALASKGKQAFFLTNNSSRSAAFYVNKLRRMGVADPFLRVVTSGQATARYAMKNYPGARAFLLGNRMLAEEMAGMGLGLDSRSPDYVIVAYDTELDYEKMRAACDFVRAGLPYLATHPDYNCPTETGFAPDAGAIIAFIKASTGREPDLIIGKPNRGIVDDILAQTNREPRETAIVGDRLYTDILTGVRHGMTSVLVLSGETTAEMLDASPIRPDFAFERLSAIIPHIGA